ncbi:MAG: DUF2807 domain-containing protein [Flavisolibacter sp.]|nr:DUF2807 domain-containing protein [Flavisolibacter sp.]
MQRIVSFILLLLVTTSAALTQKIIKDPNAEARPVSSFHAVQISKAFEAIITQGSEEGLAVSANDPKYLADIKTTVENGVLKIRVEDDKKFNWRGNRKFKAYIAVKNLDALRIAGASEVKIDGGLKTPNLKLDVAGASKLNGDLQVAGKLDIDLSGASDLNITGSADAVRIDASGASDVKAFDFRTNTANIDASGACNVRLTIDKELSVRLSGASNVAYKGNAMIRDIKTSGASGVSRKS